MTWTRPDVQQDPAHARSPMHFYADRAWIGEGPVRREVLLGVDRGRFTEVAWDTGPAPSGAARLAGLVLPGFANVHSHAFHRALRGRVQGAGDFWSWREHAYGISDVLDPDLYMELTRATYAEMMLAGVTAVGEFHYVHHARGGARYSDPNAMGRAVIEAARQAGVRLTLLDTCYLYNGMERRALEPPQLRFSDGSAGAWAERIAGLKNEEGVRIGAAIHSVRAVDAEGMRLVAEASAGRPLHFHLSEQLAENDDCLAATGLTPTTLMLEAGALGPSSTAVHATHVTSVNVAELGNSGTSVCFCPTTERDLADGIGPARDLSLAGARLCLGTDSHAVIDPFEETRAIELNERLAQRSAG